MITTDVKGDKVIAYIHGDIYHPGRLYGRLTREVAPHEVRMLAMERGVWCITVACESSVEAMIVRANVDRLLACTPEIGE